MEKKRIKSFEEGTADMKAALFAYRKTLALPVLFVQNGVNELTDLAAKSEDEWLKAFAGGCEVAAKAFRRSVFDCLVNALYRAATERSRQ